MRSSRCTIIRTTPRQRELFQVGGGILVAMALNAEEPFVFNPITPRPGRVGIARRLCAVAVETTGWVLLGCLLCWIAACAATIATPARRGEIAAFLIVLGGESILAGIVCIARPVGRRLVRRSLGVRRKRSWYTLAMSIQISLIALVTAMPFFGP